MVRSRNSSKIVSAAGEVLGYVGVGPAGDERRSYGGRSKTARVGSEHRGVLHHAGRIDGNALAARTTMVRSGWFSAIDLQVRGIGSELDERR